MAKAGTINEVIDIKAVEAQFSTVDKYIDALVVKIEGLNKAAGNIKGSGNAQQQNAAQAEANRQAQEAIRLTNQLAKAESDHAVEVERLRQKLAAQKAELRDRVKAEQAAEDSITKMEIEIRKLTKEYNNLSAAERQNRQGLKDNIKTLQDNVRALKTGVGDMKANVGNYRESLEGLKVTGEGLGQITNKTSVYLRTFTKNVIDGEQNVGKLEPTMVGLKSAISMIPGPLGQVAMGFERLTQLLKLGVIGIALGAIAAAIWGITKAVEVWNQRNDELIEKNIGFMRQLAELRGSLKAYMDDLKAQADDRSEAERKLSTNELTRIKATEDARKEHLVRMQQIENEFGGEKHELLKQATAKRRRAEEDKANAKLAERLAEINKLTDSANKKVIENAGKATNYRTQESAQVQQVTTDYEDYQRQLYEVDRLLASMGLGEEITRMTPKGTPQTVSGGTPAAKKIGGPVKNEFQSEVLSGADYEKYIQDQQRAEAEVWNQRLSIAADTLAKIDGLVNQSFANRFAQIDIEAQKDEEAKQKELKLAGDNATKKDDIEKKYAAKEAEREKERRRLQKEQAKYQKNAALIQSIVNTAVGVTGAVAATPGPVGIVMAALVLALGLAQTAMIASQPLPSYAKGRKGGKAELANINERGQEAVVTRSGDVYFPQGPLAYLPEGSAVIPHHELVDMAGRSATTRGLPDWTATDTNLSLRNEVNGLHRGFAMLAREIRDKKETHINITEKGIWAATSRGNVYEEWVNQHIRL